MTLMTFVRRLLAAVTLLVIASAVCVEAAPLRAGIWDVSTLVPGKGSVPPTHEVHVAAGQLALRERHFSRVSLWLEAVAERLGVIYAAVPSTEADLCHAPSSLTLEWDATQTDDGYAIPCLGEWLSAGVVRQLEKDGVAHVHFDPPQPLSLAVNGGCVPTPWDLREVVLAALSTETVVVTATLQEEAGGTVRPCKAYFELSRRPSSSVATAEKSTTSNLYAPVALLFVVIAVRLLPRYILTRTGQIDKSSYRGRNPAKLTPQRRAELLQKQRRIIEQMKAEDRANAPKEKTS